MYKIVGKVVWFIGWQQDDGVLTKIAIVQRSPDGVRTTVLPKKGTGEREMLASFVTQIGKQRPQIISWGGNAFIKLLLGRLICHGVSAPTLCHRPNKPWEGVDYIARFSDNHVDLQDMLCTGPVDGLPGIYAYMQGLWPDLEDAANTAPHTAMLTYLLWSRTMKVSGLLTEQEYEGECANLADLSEFTENVLQKIL